MSFENHIKQGTYFQRAYRLGRKILRTSAITEWYDTCFIKLGTGRYAVREERKDMKTNADGWHSEIARELLRKS